MSGQRSRPTATETRGASSGSGSGSTPCRPQRGLDGAPRPARAAIQSVARVRSTLTAVPVLDGTATRDATRLRLRLFEKAVQGHHHILVALSAALATAGWSGIEEVSVAVDMWARSPSGHRVIFEAKTLGARAELARVRGAVAQLLEYRFLYGEPSDGLCLVTNQPVSDKRVRFLAFLGIAVLVVEDGHLVPGSPNARTELDELLDGVGHAA